MKTNIVSVKYEDKLQPKTFNGRAYSYYTDIDLSEGDIVIAPTASGNKIAKVSEINVPEYRVEMIKALLRTIDTRINKNDYLYRDEKIPEVA